MEETGAQQVYRREARLLGELGVALGRAPLPAMEVRIPRHLAEQALAAWQRDDSEGPLERETCEQRVERHRAGTLALIGLSITERGRWMDDELVVELSPVFVGLAVDAADDLPPLKAWRQL
jgi:hypothetical protein